MSKKCDGIKCLLKALLERYYKSWKGFVKSAMARLNFLKMDKPIHRGSTESKLICQLLRSEKGSNFAEVVGEDR